MISISIDETHHIKDGLELYKKRYKKVMSFHDGIAPVEDEKEAFFIDIYSNKLFNRAFEKTYGFYENLSAVKSENVWFHITIDGTDAYLERYSWVGNFGEGKCVVRDFDNNYFHIDKMGKKVYKENYKYTGDFKYGIAVVINSSNKATHIKDDGILLHTKYFDELDIFHKGFAIAKDRFGYFHIDKKGNELYQTRYIKLEPFYNGCAFATTVENQKIVLNEDELDIIEITQNIVDKDKILAESFGYFKYQILFAVLKLDLLHQIENNLEIKLPDISIKLIFKWLYIEKIIDGNNNLTQLGLVIENELKPMILYWQDLPFKVSANMLESLQNGDEQFSKMYNKPYFEYIRIDEVQSELFIKMSSYYTTDYSNLLKHLKFDTEKVCDIGGGNGNLLTDIELLYPKTTTLLVDSLQQQEQHKFLKIDFFNALHVESDILLLSRVLHDWNDAKALLILENIKNSMQNNTILYIFESIVPKHLKYDKGITLSFHLLNFVGGHERTLEDFKLLLYKVDLKLVEVYDENSLISLLKVMKIR